MKLGVLFLGLFSSFAFAYDCTASLLRHPTVQQKVSNAIVPIAEVLPEFDPKTEVLYANYLHHASLYFGKYYLDWDGAEYRVRQDPKVIHSGIVARLKVGAEVVQRLEASAASEAFRAIRYLSCHHRALTFLQLHGIRLKASGVLSSYRIMKNIIEGEGFVDARGNRVPQVTHVLENEACDSVEGVFAFCKKNHAEHLLTFLGGFSGITAQDLKVSLGKVTVDPELLAIPDLISSELRESISPRQRDLLFSLLQNTETRAVRRMETHYGSSHAAMQALATAVVYPLGLMREVTLQELDSALAEMFSARNGVVRF